MGIYLSPLCPTGGVSPEKLPDLYYTKTFFIGSGLSPFIALKDIDGLLLHILGVPFCGP